MPGDILVVGENYHPLSIWRDVREPIIQFVRGDLLLLAAVRAHAPDLHDAGALGVEVNVFSVGGILRTVVQPLRSREPRLVPARDGDTVNVELAVALADESQSLSVG